MNDLERAHNPTHSLGLGYYTPYLLFAAGCLAVFHGFWQTGWLRNLTIAATLCGGIVMWPHTSKKTRRLAGVFLGLAALGAWWAPLSAILEGFVQAAEVVALLLAIQFLSDAVARGGFDIVIRDLLGRLRVDPSWVALLGGYVFSWAFLFTSIPIVAASLASRYRSAQTHSGPTKAPTATGVLLVRAFAAASIATPLQPTVVLAVLVAGTSLDTFLTAAIPLSLILAVLAPLSLRLEMGKREPPAEAAHPSPTLEPETTPLPAAAYPALAGFFFSLGLLVVGTASLPVRVLPALSAAFVFASIFWISLGRKIFAAASVRSGQAVAWSQLPRTYSLQVREGALLIITGSLAGFALIQTPFVETAADFLLRRAQTPWVAALVTIVTVVLFRMIGVVPAVIMITAGPILHAGLSLSPLPMALSLSAGTTLAVMLSPLSVINVIAGTVTGTTPVEVSFPRQYRFSIAAAVVAVTYILLWV